MSLTSMGFCLVFLVAGCSELNLNPNPVKHLDNGDYVYYFNNSDGCFGSRIKDCAKQKLESLNLVPAECKNGIEVLSGGESQNDWAHATFRCK